ncbi:MAG: hypothetical protein IKE30_08680, partial [Clostridia bacterium]|nr:hypothetical protein [Clostridia bacterium]
MRILCIARTSKTKEFCNNFHYNEIFRGCQEKIGIFVRAVSKEIADGEGERAQPVPAQQGMGDAASLQPNERGGERPQPVPAQQGMRDEANRKRAGGEGMSRIGTMCRSIVRSSIPEEIAGAPRCAWGAPT